jgi:hypothetical protein
MTPRNGIKKGWTIAKDLGLRGPQFTTKAGYYQLSPELDYSADGTNEENWTTILNFAGNGSSILGNTQCRVLSRIVVSKTGTFEDKTPIAKAGNPFVLVSFDKDLDNDQKIID